MERLEALAEDLIKKERKDLMPAYFREVGGVKVTFPYHFVEFASYDERIPHDMVRSYQVMDELFSKEFPSHWRDFLEEIEPIRRENGCDNPVDMIYAASVLESPRIKELDIPEFEDLPSGDIDITDKERVKMIINGYLSDSILREQFKQELVWSIPDGSLWLPEKEEVLGMLQEKGIESGVFLDLGCGLGKETVDWAERVSLKVVGIERQFHSRWYKDVWLGKEADFIRADFTKGIPFQSNSIDAVCLRRVIGYITPQSLTSALIEAERVLKEGRGLLAVGPQAGVDYSEWRFFQKDDSFLNEFS